LSSSLEQPMSAGERQAADKVTVKGRMREMADRGLTDEVLDTLRALLDRVASLGDVEEAGPDAATRARAVASLEAWYREWAGIARVVVTNRAHLRILGLRNGRRAATPVQDEPDAQAVAPIEAPEPRAALPAQSGDAPPQPSAQLPPASAIAVEEEYAPWFGEANPPGSAE
jgi:hypothetical protein